MFQTGEQLPVLFITARHVPMLRFSSERITAGTAGLFMETAAARFICGFVVAVFAFES
jgi:hypothetical protein